MRIVAGTAKGTRLAGVPRGVRPLSDRAREGLFASLGPSVGGARVLDLYAGTGAVGIEALSRGAGEATFVDRSAAAVRAIRENLERTCLEGRATVIGADVRAFLRRNGKRRGEIDLCFLDPPYAVQATELAGVLAGLDAGWLAPQAWTVALSRGVRSSTPVIPVSWQVARRLEYGDSLVVLYQEV